MAIGAVVWLVCRFNPPTAVADIIGDRHVDLNDHCNKPWAAHQVELPFEPMGPWAMWARCSLNHESINLKFTSSSNKPAMKLNSSFGLDFPILDSGATSSGTKELAALSNTYRDNTVVGGALGKYSVCTVRGDLSFTAYDRKTRKFAHVTMADTCYIPDLQQDLFSIAKLQKEGLYFSNESMTLHTKTAATGERSSELPLSLSHGLYRIPVVYSNRAGNSMSSEHQAIWKRWGDDHDGRKESLLTLATASPVGWSHNHQPKYSIWYSPRCEHPTNYHSTVSNANCVSFLETNPSTARLVEKIYPLAKVTTNTLGDLLESDVKLQMFCRDNMNSKIIFASPPDEDYRTTGSMKGLKTSSGRELLSCVAMLGHLPSVDYLVVTVTESVDTHFPGTLKVLAEAGDKLGYKMFKRRLNSAHFGTPESQRRLYIVFQSKESIERVGEFEFPSAVGEIQTVRSILSADRNTCQRLEVTAKRKMYTVKESKLTVKPVAVGEIKTDSHATVSRIYSIDHTAQPVSEATLYHDTRFDIVRPLDTEERFRARAMNSSLLSELQLSSTDLETALREDTNPIMHKHMQEAILARCMGECEKRTYVSDDVLNWTPEQAHVRCIHTHGNTARLLGFKSLPYKCKCCSMGGIKRKPRSKERVSRYAKPGHKIGIDFLPFSVPSRESGSTMLMVAVCYHTNRIFIAPMCGKDETIEAFQSIEDQIATDDDCEEILIHSLRGDSDSNFLSSTFQDHLQEHTSPIIFSASSPGDQHQNGLVERINGILKDKLMTHLIASNREPDMWLACARWLVYTYNRMPCQGNVSGMSPYESWY